MNHTLLTTDKAEIMGLELPEGDNVWGIYAAP